ncbi:unnamed protein product [Thelazia callipaeda]|uniref:DB domain-containing protein n=1 Tax=Thelazia callipaeda TaxID=103827 RepID=A0A0N5D6Z5_THECL|nr:unnamed protein product [Thelazia callipaeda]
MENNGNSIAQGQMEFPPRKIMESDAMMHVWLVQIIAFAFFENGLGEFRSRCNILHYKHCCNPTIYNICFDKCHFWAAQNCFSGIKTQLDSVLSNPVHAREVLSVLKECGTLDSEFIPCIHKETADRIFYDCCQLYIEPECHDLCRYEIKQSVAHSTLMKIIRAKKCPIKSIFAILYCASQNRDNRLCCRQFGLASPKLNVGKRCLRMCDPYQYDMSRLQEDDIFCLNFWDIIMFCHYAGLRY